MMAGAQGSEHKARVARLIMAIADGIDNRVLERCELAVGLTVRWFPDFGPDAWPDEFGVPVPYIRAHGADIEVIGARAPGYRLHLRVGRDVIEGMSRGQGQVLCDLLHRVTQEQGIAPDGLCPEGAPPVGPGGGGWGP